MARQWEEAPALYLQLDAKVCCKFGIIWVKVLALLGHNTSVTSTCLVIASYLFLHCVSFTGLTVIISWR